MYKLGLTGGIGSGKSAVATLLAQWGAYVIDTDVISHQITSAGGSAIPPIQQVFGDTFILANGSLDRNKMREEVFSNPSSRKNLEAITHPLIEKVVEDETHKISTSDHYCYAVYVVPLLIESGRWLHQVPPRLDGLLVVDCPKLLQIERVHHRNGLDFHTIEQIIAAQATPEQRSREADWVIMNDQDLFALEKKTRNVHEQILLKIAQN